MADTQPWRNPRPAPSLAEIRAKTPTPRPVTWLWVWWPAIVWSGVIFTMSTDTFSAEHTGRVLYPILRWMIPSLTMHQFHVIHHLIRKCAHFSEYFVYFLLLYRAIRGRNVGWRWTWGIAAVFCAAGYAALDEVHQAFVASRTASPYDSMLDTAGALAALVVLRLWFRSQSARAETEAATSTPPAA